MNSSPSISVILPVWNEAENLPSAIEYIRKTSFTFPTEIIVVDGGSSDRTQELARRVADCVIVSTKKGRAVQMHLGAKCASGDLFLFLHADSRLPENWQELIHKTFFLENPPVAASFSLAFDSDKIFYQFLAFLANFRTKLTGIPQGDQALVVSRETYFFAGGFPDVPLMEEYLFVPRLKHLGEVRVLREKVKTSCRKYELKGPFRNSLKNSFLILLFYLGVSPKRLATWY